MEEVDKIKNCIEQKDVYDDATKLWQHMQFLFFRHEYSDDVQRFINETIEKYRNKKEMKNYRFPVLIDYKDCDSQYGGLCAVQKILYDYSVIKFIESRAKNDK